MAIIEDRLLAAVIVVLRRYRRSGRSVVPSAQGYDIKGFGVEPRDMLSRRVAGNQPDCRGPSHGPFGNQSLSGRGGHFRLLLIYDGHCFTIPRISSIIRDYSSECYVTRCCRCAAVGA